MGMSIDEAISHLYTYSSTMGSGQTTQAQHEEAKRVAIETMRNYQQLQADYEARLKADMVAMLTELQLKIEELDTPMCDYAISDCIYRFEVIDIIQEKINALKEQEND